MILILLISMFVRALFMGCVVFRITKIVFIVKYSFIDCCNCNYHNQKFGHLLGVRVHDVKETENNGLISLTSLDSKIFCT